MSSGNCEDIVANENCGDNAEHFYHTFDFRGYKVVVSSGAPNHPAEYDTESRQTRCNNFNLVDA